MADTPNTPQPTAQQSFDAGQMDNQALQQPSAGDAAAPPARADVTVTTTNVGTQDGPSLLNNTTDPRNNQAEQRGANTGSALIGGDAANGAGGNNAGGEGGLTGRFANGAGGDAANGLAGNLGVTLQAGGADGATGGGADGGVAAGRAPVGAGGGAGGFAGGVGQAAPVAAGAPVGVSAFSASVNPASATAAPLAAAAPTAADPGAVAPAAPAPTAPNAINNITVPLVSDNGTVTSLPTGVNPTNQSSSDLVVQTFETNSDVTVKGTLLSGSAFAPTTDAPGSYGHISIDATGNWTYTSNDPFNSLSVGQSYTDAFLLKDIDGATTALTVTIVGTNDAPTIAAGPQSAELIGTSGVNSEPVGNSYATIQLTSADVDGTVIKSNFVYKSYEPSILTLIMKSDASITYLGEFTLQLNYYDDGNNALNIQFPIDVRRKGCTLENAENYRKQSLQELDDLKEKEKRELEEFIRTEEANRLKKYIMDSQEETEVRIRELRSIWQKEFDDNLEIKKKEFEDLLVTKMEEYAKKMEIDKQRAVKLALNGNNMFITGSGTISSYFYSLQKYYIYYII
jgi:VCBS repeat-containing protein